MLDVVETEQPFTRAMDDRVRHNHLGVEQSPVRQLAMEEPAMPIRPVHHRGYGHRMLLIFRHFFL
jgi:hypothetical protein